MTRKSGGSANLKNGKMIKKNTRFPIHNTKQVVLSFIGQNTAQTAIILPPSALSDVTGELEDSEVSSSTCHITSPLMATKRLRTSIGRGPLDKFLLPATDAVAIKRRRQEADSTCVEASTLGEKAFVDLTKDKENNEPVVDYKDEEEVQVSGSESEAEEMSIEQSQIESPNDAKSLNLSKLELSAKKNREAAERRAQKDAERAFSRAERERQHRAREAAKQALKEEREMARKEKEVERLARKLAEENEKEAKRIQKENEKLKREDERLKKEEEKVKAKRGKEEELRKEEEKKQILSQKQSNFFCGFFIKKAIDVSVPVSTFIDLSTNKESDGKVEANCSMDEPLRFAPFCLKKDMRLAPLTRLNSEEISSRLLALDDILKASSNSAITKLYLDELKHGTRLPGSDVSTWHLEPRNRKVFEESSVVEIMDLDAAPQWRRAIYLHFHEDHRPPYYGTFGNHPEQCDKRRKFSTRLAKCPSERLVGSLDYDIESSEEWEEDEPGEDVQFSGDEDDEAAALAAVEEEEMESDGFFVPHGYLSEDEVNGLSNGEADDDDALDHNLEMRKAKQVLSEREFTANLRRRITPLRPQIVVWPTPNLLCEFNAFLFPAANCLPLSVLEEETLQEEQTPLTEDGSIKKRKGFPEEVLPHLLRLVHGNSLGLDRLVFEFRAWYQGRLGLATGSLYFASANVTESVERVAFVLSKRQLRKKIREVAPQHENGRWAVKPELLALNGLTVTPASASSIVWDYVTDANQFRRSAAAENNTSANVSTTTPSRSCSYTSDTPVRSIFKYFQQQSDNAKISPDLPDTDASIPIKL